MDLLLRTIALLVPAFTYLLSIIFNIFFWYLVYATAILLFKVLYKLRFEVHNEDLKYTREECQRKLVVVTGATSGIGLAVTKYLHSKGFTVVACYFRPGEVGFRELEAKIQKETQADDGAEANTLHLVPLDITLQESIEQCHQRVVKILEENKRLRFHALINVAGVGFSSRFQWQPKKQTRAMLETNLVGPVMMSREFMLLMLKNSPHSRLINVSSPLGMLVAPFNTAYAATKAGLIQFSNALRVDAFDLGIKTISILPGNIIRNTSILNTDCQMSQATLLDTLTEDERCLYGAELEERRLFILKMNKVKDRPLNLCLDVRDKLSKNIARAVLLFGGALSSNQNLEDTNLMNSFDNAVRMRSPPVQMYAGNRFFEIVCGACLDMLNYAFFRDLGYILAKFKLSAFG